MSPESSADASGIARRDFKSVRRGYDTKAVRAYLDEVAVLVAGLQAQLVEAEARAAAAEARAAQPEELDQGRLVELVGEETAKVLDSARSAASDIRTKAQEAAGRLVSEGQEQAKAIAEAAEVEGEARKEALLAETAALHELAEGELGRRRAEAEALAAEIIGAAEAERKEIEAFRERAREQADELRAEARVQAEVEVESIRSAAAHDGEQVVAKARREAQHLVAEALGVREKLLGDLARRRRAAREQVERLNAARERLLAAYAVVQRTADEATAELKVALPAARVAADQAARRVLEEPEPTPEDIEAEMSTARMAGLVDADTGAGIEVDVAALAEQLDVNAADHLHLPDAVSWVTDPEPPSPPDGAVGADAEDDADASAGVEDLAEAPADEPLVLRLVPDLATPPDPEASDEGLSDPDPPPAEAPRPVPDAVAPAPEAHEDEPSSPTSDPATAAASPESDAEPHSTDAPAAPTDADPASDNATDAAAQAEPADVEPAWPGLADAAPADTESQVELAADAAASEPADADAEPIVEATGSADDDATGAEPGVAEIEADDGPVAEQVSAEADPSDAEPEPSDGRAPEPVGAEPDGPEPDDAEAPAPEPVGGEAPAPEPVGAEPDAPASGTEVPASEPVGAQPATTNGHEPPPPAPARRSLDELFARVRGEQPDPEPAPPPAERVPVAAAPGPGPEAEAGAEAREDRPTSWPTDVERAAARVSAARGPDAADDEGDAALLQRRDTALGGIEALLSRRLKRVLADEENDVLDLLRRSLPASVDEVLPELDDHVAAYAQVAVPQLALATAEGAALVGGPDATNADTATRAGDRHSGPPHLRPVTGADTLATELGVALVEPLRARVLRTIEDGNDVEDVTRRLRSLYREWKGQRVGAAARHYAAAAYARGALDEAAGTEVRWMVDRTGEPCPDADDNALAGAVRAGDPFPTGDRCPPAHPGCRCLVVPAGGVSPPPEA